MSCVLRLSSASLDLEEAEKWYRKARSQTPNPLPPIGPKFQDSELPTNLDRQLRELISCFPPKTCTLHFLFISGDEVLWFRYKLDKDRTLHVKELRMKTFFSTSSGSLPLLIDLDKLRIQDDISSHFESLGVSRS